MKKFFSRLRISQKESYCCIVLYLMQDLLLIILYSQRYMYKCLNLIQFIII